MKGSFDQEKALRAWQRFIQMGELVPQIPAPIARSWFRCKNRGQLPIQLLPARLAKAEDPPATHPGLAEVFRATFRELKDYLAAEELLLVLLDPKGVLVDWQGNSRLILSGTLEPGMRLDEATVGTMATSLAVEERETVYVAGAHHYYSCYHQLATVAAPVLVAGSVAGILGACTAVQNSSLGILAVLLGKKVLEAGFPAGNA